MAEQPATGVQDLMCHYKERIHVASRQLRELQIHAVVCEAQLAKKQRDTNQWRECIKTVEWILELAQDEIRFQLAWAAYYYAMYMTTMPNEMLQVQHFSQYA